MQINDLTILGRTEPQETKKHGVIVCTAGYSRELRQFLRIYPLPLQNNMLAKWATVSVDLRRNPQDSRFESWRINAEDEDVFNKIKLNGKSKKDSEFDWLKANASTLEKLNENKLSLGILKPDSLIDLKMERVANTDFSEQLRIFDDTIDRKINKNDITPRLYFSVNGVPHKMRLDEWGCHEFIRKNRSKLGAVDMGRQLTKNLKLDDSNYEHLFFIGNLNAHRRAWIVISVISRKISKQVDLF